MTVCLSQSAFDKHAADTRPGGLLVYDSGLVEPGDSLPGRDLRGIPFTQAAAEHLTKTVVANIVAVGALVEISRHGAGRGGRGGRGQPRARSASARSTSRPSGSAAAWPPRRRPVDLLEHQGKALFAGAGLPVLPSRLAFSPAEARAAAGELGLPVVVKAQVKTGGRGKAGGIRVERRDAAATPEEVAAAERDRVTAAVTSRQEDDERPASGSECGAHGGGDD